MLATKIVIALCSIGCLYNVAKCLAVLDDPQVRNASSYFYWALALGTVALIGIQEVAA